MSGILLCDKRITVSLEEGIGRIIFIDAERFNALDASSCQAFSDAATWLSLQADLRVVLLQARGRAFCVGGSIKEFSKAGDHVDGLINSMTTHFHTAVARLMRMDAPVIAVVNGNCGGGGASLTCIADMTLMADTAKINFAYSLSGLSPDGGASYGLPRIVGARKAYELLVLNPTLDASEAKKLGIASRIVPAEALDHEANELAAQLASGPTKAFGSIKKLLLNSFRNSAETQMFDEANSIARLASGPDGREGVEAFLQKRRPNFQG